jgi:hypothetical protein
MDGNFVPLGGITRVAAALLGGFLCYFGCVQRHVLCIAMMEMIPGPSCYGWLDIGIVMCHYCV